MRASRSSTRGRSTTSRSPSPDSPGTARPKRGTAMPRSPSPASKGRSARSRTALPSSPQASARDADTALMPPPPAVPKKAVPKKAVGRMTAKGSGKPKPASKTFYETLFASKGNGNKQSLQLRPSGKNTGANMVLRAVVGSSHRLTSTQNQCLFYGWTIPTLLELNATGQLGDKPSVNCKTMLKVKGFDKTPPVDAYDERSRFNSTVRQIKALGRKTLVNNKFFEQSKDQISANPSIAAAFVKALDTYKAKGGKAPEGATEERVLLDAYRRLYNSDKDEKIQKAIKHVHEVDTETGRSHALNHVILLNSNLNLMSHAAVKALLRSLGRRSVKKSHVYAIQLALKQRFFSEIQKFVAQSAGKTAVSSSAVYDSLKQAEYIDTPKQLTCGMMWERKKHMPVEKKELTSSQVKKAILEASKGTKGEFRKNLPRYVYVGHDAQDCAAGTMEIDGKVYYFKPYKLEGGTVNNTQYQLDGYLSPKFKGLKSLDKQLQTVSETVYKGTEVSNLPCQAIQKLYILACMESAKQ